MNLEQYLYEYMCDGGSNPSLLKKFITYLEDNTIEVNDYPRAVDDFMESLAFSGSTKRNYRSSCNRFIKFVYRRLGLFLPHHQAVNEEEKQVVIEEKSKYSPMSPTRKKLEDASKKIMDQKMSDKENIRINKERVKKEWSRTIVNNTREIRNEEEYNEFLEKYERLCK